MVRNKQPHDKQGQFVWSGHFTGTVAPVGTCTSVGFLDAFCASLAGRKPGGSRHEK